MVTKNTNTDDEFDDEPVWNEFDDDENTDHDEPDDD